MKKTMRRGIFLAILAAALYSISTPFSKLLLSYMPPTLMAGALYVGAGIGMGAVLTVRKARNIKADGERITRADIPYVILMILLDVAAPILLLFGIQQTTAANASLLNNFEIVATAIIALCIFGEKISKRLWIGISTVTLACILLTFDTSASLQFSFGSLLVLGASLCWGVENNCTRKLSSKDPLIIVLLKGIFSGGTSLAIGFIIGERFGAPWSVFAVLILGFVAYGLSIFLYVYAQRYLGAARTGAYYAIAPFIGAILSLVIFKDIPQISYFIALALMMLGAWLCSQD